MSLPCSSFIKLTITRAMFGTIWSPMVVRTVRSGSRRKNAVGHLLSTAAPSHLQHFRHRLCQPTQDNAALPLRVSSANVAHNLPECVRLLGAQVRSANRRDDAVGVSSTDVVESVVRDMVDERSDGVQQNLSQAPAALA